MPFSIKDIAASVAHGLIASGAPSIAKGFLVQWLRQGKVTPEKVELLIQSRKRLWSLIPVDNYPGIRNVLNEIGSIDWLTSDWLIEAGKKEFPALASMFLSWRMARNWLDRQVEDCKEQLEKLRHMES